MQVLQAQQKAGAEGLHMPEQQDDVTGSSDPESRSLARSPSFGHGPTKPDVSASMDAEVGCSCLILCSSLTHLQMHRDIS